MKLVKYQGRSPVYIEGFPSDTERSVQGSLHLIPDKTTSMTDDEYAYIKTNRPDVSKSMVLLRSY